MGVDGVDYRNIPVVVTFSAENASSYATIDIKKDTISDNSEQFRATFNLPPGYKNLQKGYPSEAVVTINELKRT